MCRFQAFFTTSDLPTIEADKVRRAHAIVEQVFADLKSSAVSQLPSGKVNANASTGSASLTYRPAPTPDVLARASASQAPDRAYCGGHE